MWFSMVQQMSGAHDDLIAVSLELCDIFLSIVVCHYCPMKPPYPSIPNVLCTLNNISLNRLKQSKIHCHIPAKNLVFGIDACHCVIPLDSF